MNDLQVVNFGEHPESGERQPDEVDRCLKHVPVAPLADVHRPLAPVVDGRTHVRRGKPVRGAVTARNVQFGTGRGLGDELVAVGQTLQRPTHDDLGLVELAQIEAVFHFAIDFLPDRCAVWGVV